MSAFTDLHSFMANKLAWQEAIIRDQRLTAIARLIGCQMMHDLHSERRGAWRSQEAIAALIGVDVRTVRRALAALAGHGYFKTTVSHGRGHANFYEPVFSPPENRALVSANGAENRALASSDAGENRTLEAAKPDTSTPPYLEINPNPPIPPTAGDVTADQWAKFEAAYPENCATTSGWRRARLAFERIVEGGQASAETLIAAAAAYARSRAGRGIDRTKAPQHWLREDCWRGRVPANCNQPALAPTTPFPDQEVRDAVCAVMGEAAAISYLDPAMWRAIDRTVVCRLGTAGRALQDRASRALRGLGVVVIADAAEHMRLASLPAATRAA